MAPITNIIRSLDGDEANNTVNGVRGITHTLDQSPFRHLSLWAYFALGIILLVLTIVLGYAVFTCYRSAAVDVEATVETPVQGDIYTEGRTSPRSGGRRKEMIQAKRRGIVTFSDKAKVFGRQSQDKNTQEKRKPSAGIIDVIKQKKQFKSPQPHVTNVVDVSIRSYSSDGDSSYAHDHLPLSTPPRAYFQDSRRQSPVKRTINSTANTRGSLATAPATPKIPSTSPKHSKPLTPSATRTPLTPKASTPTSRGTSPTDSNEIKYDSHNIRFVLPREKSMESLENARLWKDPKLSPVGGNIIHPFPAPQQHMPLDGVSQQKDPRKKKIAAGVASLDHSKTEKAKRRR